MRGGSRGSRGGRNDQARAHSNGMKVYSASSIISVMKEIQKMISHLEMVLTRTPKSKLMTSILAEVS